MPLPQVNDRLKEIPAQALRTVFATIGQLLLVADRFRARAAEQLSGSGESTAAGPENQAPAAAPPAAPPAPRSAPAEDAESARWRSLDKTGNVRVLDGDDEHDAEDLAASAAGPPIPEPVTPEAVHAPVEYTPTEPVAAVPAPAEPQPADPPVPDPADLAVPEPAEPQPAGPAVPDAADLAVPEPAEPAIPDPADLAVPEPAEPAIPDPADLAVPPPAEPAIPEPAGLAPVEPAPAGFPAAEPVEPASAALPVPNYDQLTVPSLRARLRGLDAAGVQMLLDYEKAHEGRPAVVTMFERRLTKLSEGS